MTGRLHLGTQGFAFDDWVGPFYPPGTPSTTYLELYAQQFSTVEIDSTFYAAPRASVVEGWRERTLDGFTFAAKFPKQITHDKQLVGAQAEATAFVERMQILAACGRRDRTLQPPPPFGPRAHAARRGETALAPPPARAVSRSHGNPQGEGRVS